MHSAQLRRAFLDFFAARDHVVRPSASLIPVDPTLLLTNAGMVPFKPYFLGEEPAPFDRAVSVQKCVRTIDIDIIGTTARHLSFFEMMGNFSFGDYFKSDAIAYAHEFVTEVLGLEEDGLWYTVHETDEEARAIWLDQERIAPERVQFGGKDNFWQMGVPGPCGPSSEIFYDRGEQYGEGGGPIGGDEDRYVEIWNLVFMQNIQDAPYHVIGDLPAKNIDTGMGLERTAMVLQGAESGFEVDTLRAMIDRGSRFTGVAYGADPMSDVSLRIIGDHGRTVTMLIADGVRPSNTGRGYVLRRVMRRAVRHAWQLGGSGLIMPDLVETCVTVMKDGYPELVEKQDLIAEIVEREEARFRQTLASGHTLLASELESLDEGSALPGEVAFKLHDTFGFPIELTQEVAAEAGVVVDEAGFEAAMAEQRERAKAAFKGGVEAETGQMYLRLQDEIGPTEFVGYVAEAAHATVLAVLREGEQVDEAESGQQIEVFLDVTPFYAESGGQVGDTGTITTESGVIAVHDTQHALQGFHGHRGRVVDGTVRVGQPAELQIDSLRREHIRKSHTGTHILHWALRDVVGDHAHQAGSLVEAGRLRFDFSHFAGLTSEEKGAIERLTNEKIIANAAVSTEETTMEEAKQRGALAFFGDKYGDRVRVVEIGGFSTELCGGTHTPSAGQVGPVLLTSESSIGSNVRRVEALTGEAAYEQIVAMRDALQTSAAALRTGPFDVPARLESLLETNRQLEERLEQMTAKSRGEQSGELAAGAEQLGDHRYVVASAGDVPPDALRQLALAVRERLGNGVVVLGSAPAGKGALIGVVTKDLVERGLSAAELITPAARQLGGGGSRDPELAQAGGPHGEHLQTALDTARSAVEAALAGV